MLSEDLTAGIISAASSGLTHWRKHGSGLHPRTCNIATSASPFSTTSLCHGKVWWIHVPQLSRTVRARDEPVGTDCPHARVERRCQCDHAVWKGKRDVWLQKTAKVGVWWAGQGTKHQCAALHSEQAPVLSYGTDHGRDFHGAQPVRNTATAPSSSSREKRGAVGAGKDTNAPFNVRNHLK